MKWLLFAISLFALWVAFNALFMLPGRYSAFNFELAAAGIVIGIATAWLSGKRFVDTGRRGKRGALMQAPPVVLCTFILVIFCAMGILKVVASR